MTKRQSERLFSKRNVKTPAQAFKDLNEIFDKGPDSNKYKGFEQRTKGVEPYDTPYNLRNWDFDRRAVNV